MPALGMAQETGTLLRWLKEPGDTVTKGEMLMEVETDKAMVEVEANASGILSDVTAKPGDVVPVGKVIARIVAPNEAAAAKAAPAAPQPAAAPRVSPLAARVAAEHGVDVAQIKTAKGVIQKEDVLAYVEQQKAAAGTATLPVATANEADSRTKAGGTTVGNGKVLASPKARRLASERGLELKHLTGSGPEGAVLAQDVLMFTNTPAFQDSLLFKGAAASAEAVPAQNDSPTQGSGSKTEPSITAEMGEDERVAVGSVWRVMVERLSNAWTTIPHFYLTRDVNATRLMQWRDAVKAAAAGQSVDKITYTDLLVKLVAAALHKHPRVNASYDKNEIVMHRSINIGLAVAIEQGLTVPVIHNAGELSLAQLTAQRKELIERAQNGKLGLNDISGGTFTISNLGMYGVDAFNAIVNPPQAAILAVSRITERVVPINHQPSVQPMMTLTMSCDHRVVDGARGAQFLDTLAQLIEEPLGLLS